MQFFNSPSQLVEQFRVSFHDDQRLVRVFDFFMPPELGMHFFNDICTCNEFLFQQFIDNF